MFNREQLLDELARAYARAAVDALFELPQNEKGRGVMQLRGPVAVPIPHRTEDEHGHDTPAPPPHAT